MEYRLGCKGEEVKHRDNCYHGNNVKFILHHFLIIVADVMCIHNVCTVGSYRVSSGHLAITFEPLFRLKRVST